MLISRKGSVELDSFLDKVSQPKPIVHSVSKKVLYFSLPYTGKHSLQIHTQISRLCSSAYPHLNIRFVFRPTLRLSHLFSSKDKIPKALRSCVVYSFKCRCCSASYLGQTVRHLHTRVSEHLGVSAFTGHKSCSPVMSSIFSHLNGTGHTASLDDFKSFLPALPRMNFSFGKAFLFPSTNLPSTYRAVQSLSFYFNLVHSHTCNLISCK